MAPHIATQVAHRESPHAFSTPTDHIDRPLVILLGKSVISPSPTTTSNKKRSDDLMFLSCLDLFWKDCHFNRRLLFYKSSDENSFHILKQSLASVLEWYYPWAGRIARGSDRRLVIDCNGAGVEFVEAWTDMETRQLAKKGFQMSHVFLKLCQEVDNSRERLYTAPLLSVQATKFSDGGLALGVAVNHMVADGQALWNFMVSWGECARGMGLSLQPIHGRERLAVLKPSPSLPKPDFIQFDGGSAGKLTLSNGHITNGGFAGRDGTHIVHAQSGDGKLDNGAEYSNGNSEEYADDSKGNKAVHVMMGEDVRCHTQAESVAQCVFDMPAEAVKALKAEAGGAFTSFEVTCAHFWQRITVARQPPPGKPTVFTVLASCRTRLQPPLPASYFGNAITFSEVAASAEEICNEDLSKTAARIHDGVVKCSEDGVLSFMNWLELNDWTLLPTFKPVGTGINVASSPRFPVYEVDFGWGRPAGVRCVNVPGNGEMVFFGGRPGTARGDVEVCLGIEASAMRRLLEDPLFLAKPPTNSFHT